MINVTKVILREQLNIYANSSIEGYAYNSKGLKAYLEMKNYSVIDCKENKDLFTELDSEVSSIQLDMPKQTLIGFIINNKEFMSYSEFIKYHEEEVDSTIPEFKKIMSYVITPNNHSSIESINKQYVEYLYKFDSKELVNEKVRTVKYIKVQFNGSVHNIAIPAIVIMPKRIINRRYVSGRDYANILLSEIKSDIGRDMECSLVNVTKEDIERYNTRDKSLILLYKLIADKEV